MGIRHTVPSGLPAGTVSGKVAGDDWRADHLHVPFSITLGHGGTSGTFTTGTAVVSNSEQGTAPALRCMVDLSQASQARLVIGQRVLAATFTTAFLRLQYSTDQSSWVELASVSGAGDVSLLGGSTNRIRSSSWFDIAAGAKSDNIYLRLVFTSTGSTGTAATYSFVDVLLK